MQNKILFRAKTIFKFTFAFFLTFAVYNIIGYNSMTNADGYESYGDGYGIPISGEIIYIPNTSINGSTLSVIISIVFMLAGILLYQIKSIRYKFIQFTDPILQKILSLVIPGHKKLLFEKRAQR